MVFSFALMQKNMLDTAHQYYPSIPTKQLWFYWIISSEKQWRDDKPYRKRLRKEKNMRGNSNLVRDMYKFYSGPRIKYCCYPSIWKPPPQRTPIHHFLKYASIMPYHLKVIKMCNIYRLLKKRDFIAGLDTM